MTPALVRYQHGKGALRRADCHYYGPRSWVVECQTWAQSPTGTALGWRVVRTHDVRSLVAAQRIAQAFIAEEAGR